MPVDGFRMNNFFGHDTKRTGWGGENNQIIRNMFGKLYSIYYSIAIVTRKSEKSILANAKKCSIFSDCLSLICYGWIRMDDNNAEYGNAH